MSKPVALNGHQSICECLKASERSLSKADPSIMQCLPVVLWKLVSILMELLVGSESYSLPLCVYVCMGVGVRVADLVIYSIYHMNEILLPKTMNKVIHVYVCMCMCMDYTWVCPLS